MIDRLELKTSRYGHFIESRNKRIPRGVSQLLEEDQDIIELKRSDLNPLYRQYITHTVLSSNGKPYDDPVKFYIFADPRFNRQQSDRYKIALNPNKTPIGEVMDFLFENFRHVEDRNEIFLDDFKIGRIDFNVDITTHTVEQIFRTLYLDNKSRSHVARYKMEDEDDVDIRVIGKKEMETFYIGNGMYMIRVYNKVAEAKSRIAILKGNGLEIPESLKQLAEQPLVTRVEMQIRDLYRAGIKKVDTTTGEMNVFEPQREHQKIRTFNDLLHIQENQFDVFSDLHFKTEKILWLGRNVARLSQKERVMRSDWFTDMFNAHLREHGFDTTMKKLPAETRRDLKPRIREKKFIHDLNKICIGDILTWLKN